MSQYHIQLDPGDIGEYVLLPGDPGRCELIAQRFDKPLHVRSNREFTTFTGTLDGVAVSVVSTGIGSPSTAIAAEELIAIGAKTLIRVGTCGAISPKLRMGDAVLVSGAIRNEGTSHQYVPPEFPAIADIEVLRALEESAMMHHHRYTIGIVQCCDSFYSEINPATVPVGPMIQRNWNAYKAAGCIAAEMESSTLFVIGSVRKVRTGTSLAVVNTAQDSDEPMPELDQLPIDTAIDVAVGALSVLIRSDAAVRALSPPKANVSVQI